MKRTVAFILTLSLALCVACSAEKPQQSQSSSNKTETKSQTSITETSTSQQTSREETSTSMAITIAGTTAFKPKSETISAATQTVSTTSAIQSAQTQKQLFEEPENCFDIKLFTDKTTYTTTEAITCWATLEYIGNNDSITIYHADPYLTFSITDGKDFNSSGMAEDVGMQTTINKGEVIRINYQKSGGWGANDPDAEFWENYYKQKEVILPVGEYTISAEMSYSLDAFKITETNHIQKAEVKITVQ